MAYEVILNRPGVYRILLEEQPEGTYVNVFDSPNSPGPCRDILQDDLAMAKLACKLDYSVEESQWREVENEDLHGSPPSPWNVQRIVVTPTDGATGANLIRILDAVAARSRFKSVLVGDVECDGDTSWVAQSPFLTTVDAVLRNAARAGNFDRGSFLFYPQSTEVVAAGPPFTSFREVLQNDGLVTLVRSDEMHSCRHFFIYTTDNDDALRIRPGFTLSALSWGPTKAKHEIVDPW
jgi:hypothetical protein